MGKVKTVQTKEWYDYRLADMVDMRQCGLSLDIIAFTHDISYKYASKLLCQAGVYAHKRRKPASDIAKTEHIIIQAAPAVPVKVGRWTRLAEIFASVIKRFTR